MKIKLFNPFSNISLIAIAVVVLLVPITIQGQIGRATTEDKKTDKTTIGRANSIGRSTTLIGRAGSFRIGRVGLQQLGEYKIETSAPDTPVVKKTPNPTETLLAKANLLTKEGKYETAIDAYQKILKSSPKHLNARLGLSYALLLDGNFEEARESYKAALETNINQPEAYLNYGVALYGCEQIEPAIEQFKEALNKRNGNFAAAYFNLALSFAHQGDFDQAIKHYQTAISQRTQYSEAYNNLGLVYEATGNLQAAIEHISKAIEQRKGSYPLAHYNLGRFYTSQGKLNEALNQYKFAIEQKKDFAEAYLELGNFYVLNIELASTINCTVQAETNYRKAIELRKGFYPLAHDNLATVLADQGKFNDSISEYRIAFEQYQGSCPETLQNLITTLLKKSSPSANVYSIFSELSISDNVCNLKKKKQPENIKERITKQLEKYEDLDDELKNLADVRYCAALAYMTVGQWQEAIEELKAAIELSKGKDDSAKELLRFLML